MYSIIKDSRALAAFIGWLPEVKDNECYYVALFARKKYHYSAKNDKANCTRFTATDKRWLTQKLLGLQRPDGSYTNKDGTVIHQDALALYINLNPRDMYKAQQNLAKRLIDTITAPHVHLNPASLALSEIQKAKGTTHYVDFDFDDVGFGFLKTEINYIASGAYKVLQTRGGFHLIVDPSKIKPEFKKSWYNFIASLQGCDVAGDSLIPVPGCCQGDFVPVML